jgi:NADH dehydrogenase
LTFTIAGGGFTGVELACNLAEYIQVAKKLYPSLRAVQPQIRLIHSGSKLLPALEPQFKRLVQYAERQLNAFEIEVLTNTRITRATEGGVFLNDNTFKTHSLLISTVGQKRRVLRGTEMMVRDTQQRLFTTPYQQLLGYSTIWGGGDACYVPHPVTQEACPANALWAIKHGHYVGKNIARAIKGRPLRPFSYKGLGQSASLGVGKGLTELYGFQFTGWLAWLMRWFFFMYFMPSRRTMLRAVGDWMQLLIRRQRTGLQSNKQFISYTNHQTALTS